MVTFSDSSRLVLTLRKGYNFFEKSQLNLNVKNDQLLVYRITSNLNISIITKNTNQQTDYISYRNPAQYVNIQKLNSENSNYTLVNQKVVYDSQNFDNYKANNIKYMYFGSFNIKASLYVYDSLNLELQKTILVQNYDSVQIQSIILKYKINISYNINFNLNN